MALVLRAVKGSPLTITEMDGNFTHLNERFTALNASNLTSGTLPDARLSSNVVLGSRTITSGSGLSGGGNLSGNLTLTVDGTVIRTTGNQTVGGVKTFTSRMVLNGGTGIDSTAGVLVVRQNGDTYTNGVTLTSSHTTFTRIWKDASGTTHISSSNTTGGISISTTGVVSTVGNLNVGGTLSGNGSSLTSLSASNLGSGTVPTARLSGTYGINITGSAGSASSATTATRLATARTISLTGDVSGSTTFDGSGNVSITASVSNNSHTHTWANITAKPATATRWPTPAEVGAYASGSKVSDSNLLDGINSSAFLRSNVNDTATGLIKFQRNTTSPTYSSGQVEFTTTDGSDVSIGFYRSGHSACQLRHSSNGLILSGTSRTNVANFKAFGDIYGASFNINSDSRLKTNINQLTNNKELNAYSWNWAENKATPKSLWGEHSIGVLAQEVEEIYPELVTENEGYKTVDYSRLGTMLSLRNAEYIEKLEKRINTLENESIWALLKLKVKGWIT